MCLHCLTTEFAAFAAALQAGPKPPPCQTIAFLGETWDVRVVGDLVPDPNAVVYLFTDPA